MFPIALVTARIQSSLDSTGSYASNIERLWWIFFWVSVVVYAAVVMATVYATFHRRHSHGELASEKRATGVITAATGVTVVTLFALLVSSILTGRSIAELPATPVDVVLTAKQWWWQVEYTDGEKDKHFITANELTIPVGVPVMVRLRSSDVIHSFWIPNLHGKRDIIPGRDAGLIIQADKPGVYRGQCAEFCGLQHAKMAFWVNAVSKEEYLKWADDQRLPSKIPSTAEQRKGMDVFMNGPCPLCHNIAGTNASGKVAPDLTHFASRRSIAAGTIPNRRGYLAGWIVDPQHIKPGAYMPSMPMEKGDLQPMLAYLESLR